MRSRILQLLKADSGPVSGEALSARLGISRVAVWKHIRKLQELGYGIRSGPTGYRLNHIPDIPYPWEFPGREARIHYFPEIDSTMDVAADLAAKKADHLSVVVADRQTRGRGRLKRKWDSTDGGLYFTIILRPPVPPALGFRYNFAASLVLARLLKDRYGIDARVKWPNDILVAEKKISGMLSEMTAEMDRIAYLNIGMGINVNNDPTGIEPRATSLKLLLKRTVQRRSLLEDYLDTLEERLIRNDLDGVIQQWKAECITLGRRVDITTPRGTSRGTAVDVDENGALILKRDDGSTETVIYGDCFHQPWSGSQS